MNTRTLLLGAALAALFGCKSETAEKITITGSSTVAPLVLELGKRFEAKYPGVRVDVQTGGSSRGMTDAKTGVADIGMVSRALTAEESAELTAHTIAKDGITLILHKTNPISALSDQQIIGIYSGAIINWKEVGGHDAPITVVNKAEGRSTLELFVAHFELKAPEIKAQVVIGDNQQGIKTVAGNPNAIGYVSIGTAEYDLTRGVPIKLLPLAGIEPSSESVRADRFPLSRPLNLVTAAAGGAPQGVVKNFLDFARSKEVHDIVRGQSFVPVEP